MTSLGYEEGSIVVREADLHWIPVSAAPLRVLEVECLKHSFYEFAFLCFRLVFIIYICLGF